MQTRAILGAACELKKEGKDPKPEIMVPLVGILYELKQQKEVILATAKEVFAEEGIEVEFEIGTMIETPRAAQPYRFGSRVLLFRNERLDTDDIRLLT